jgi:hypothetical protein
MVFQAFPLPLAALTAARAYLWPASALAPASGTRTRRGRVGLAYPLSECYYEASERWGASGKVQKSQRTRRQMAG